MMGFPMKQEFQFTHSLVDKSFEREIITDIAGSRTEQTNTIILPPEAASLFFHS